LAPLSPTLSHPYHPAQELAAIDWAAQEQETALLLSRYLQFDTTNPPGQEAPAIEFLAEVLHERGFVPHIIEPAPGRANLIVRLSSQAVSAAPPCLLYAHADVVPADASRWSVPPFGGHMRDGFVWGRGALDDKSLGIIFLQVLTLLKTHLSPLQRDIILLIAADEEAHGRYGVGWLLDHHLDLIRAGYVWDEGGVGLTPMAARWR
jgi:acetylornithine deacetylase/succinyl-diaminopimelate desuccinylase-like protein